MTISATAKSKVYIGTTAAAVIVEDFEDDTFVQVKDVVDMGEVGFTAAEITGTFVDQDFVRRRKGALDSGTVELIVARNPADAGQNALRAAAFDDELHNFKVELNDKPEAAGTNTVFYFRALVMGNKSALGTSENLLQTTFPLGIDGGILEVPAAAAVVP